MKYQDQHFLTTVSAYRSEHRPALKTLESSDSFKIQIPKGDLNDDFSSANIDETKITSWFNNSFMSGRESFE